ncbi:hypothetical protein [Microbulbifer sp. TRSA007]|uniref:hypothetical protein n=1 Tax=Microbulbifer sp. TRSA007 TaxID=3243384 RepID=UPI004039E138
MFKKIRVRFPDISVFLVFLVLIALLPIVLLATPFFLISARRQEKALEEEYKKFLLAHEGSEIFCYTNRGNSVNLIGEFVLPQLPKGTHIVKLEGKKVCTNLNENYISFMLYQLNEVGFPNVIKISNGSIVDLSLKKKVYSAINQSKVETLSGIVISGLNHVRESARNA